MHIGSDTIQGTLVIEPEIDHLALELLVGLIKIELLVPLYLEVKASNVFKGVTSFVTLEEDDFSGMDCNGACDNCKMTYCSVDEENSNTKG